MHVPVFLDALPLLLEPVAVGLTEELLLVVVVVVVAEETTLELVAVVNAAELVFVDSVELVWPSEEELVVKDGASEVVDAVELIGIVSVVVISAEELEEEDEDDIVKLLLMDEVVKLCAVVTSAVLVGASVGEFVEAVL